MSLADRPDTLAAFFADDHHRCDDAWGAIEQAIDRRDPAALTALWETFEQTLRQHLAMEEEVLFPAFEEATGMTGGPTYVMRLEHTQMRAVLAQMASAAVRGDSQEVLDQGDTLLMLIQQHNAKEEAMLYPMSEQVLGGMWAGLRDRVQPYVA
jgi:hemerythrin-like domain-containing protein